MAAISSTDSTDIYDVPEARLTESAPDVKSGVFTAQGRMGVLKYMAHSTILLLSMMAVLLITALMTGVSFTETSGPPKTAPLLVAVMLVATLPVIWIGCVMMIKRLHDLNLSGWLILLTLIPILGALVSLFIMCAPGMKQSNKFGPVTAPVAWEKVVGMIGLALFVLTVIGSITAMVAPSILGLN